MTTPSNTDTELQAAIDEFGEDCYEDRDASKAEQKLKALIARRDTEKREALLKAVGEDEDGLDYRNHLAASTKIPLERNQEQAKVQVIGRNRLRRDIRQAIESIYRGRQQ